MKYRQRYFCRADINLFCLYVIYTKVSWSVIHREAFSISGIDKISQFIVHTGNIGYIIQKNYLEKFMCNINSTQNSIFTLINYA